MKFNLTSEQEKWATSTWQAAVSDGYSQATALEEYLTALLQPQFDQMVSAVVDSWRPVDAPEVAARREALVARLKEIPADELAAIEAIVVIGG